MQKISEFRDLGYATPGVHEGIGIHTNFVLHLIFASREDKETYEQIDSYKYFLRKLKRYSKRGGFKFITN